MFGVFWMFLTFEMLKSKKNILTSDIHNFLSFLTQNSTTNVLHDSRFIDRCSLFVIPKFSQIKMSVKTPTNILD